MDKSLRWDYILEAVAIGGTAAQTKAIFQFISLGVTIASVLVSLAFTLYKWYKEAKKRRQNHQRRSYASRGAYSASGGQYQRRS